MAETITCEMCLEIKPKHAAYHSDWYLLWQRDLHFCSESCIAKYFAHALELSDS